MKKGFQVQKISQATPKKLFDGAARCDASFAMYLFNQVEESFIYCFMYTPLDSDFDFELRS